MVCLVKESKQIQKERKLSKMGIEVKRKVHREEAEIYVDSSGISDSSASSSEEDEDSNHSETKEAFHLVGSVESDFDDEDFSEQYDDDNGDDENQEEDNDYDEDDDNGGDYDGDEDEDSLSDVNEVKRKLL